MWIGWFIEKFLFLNHHCRCYYYVFIYGYLLLVVFNIFFHGMTVISLYALVWCIYQDKPYGAIIFTTISFRAYNDNYQLWSFILFYIWTLTKLLSKHQSMFWHFGCFDIVTIIFFHTFCMLYHVWLCSWHLCNITLLIFFFVNNYPIRIFFVKW